MLTEVKMKLKLPDEYRLHQNKSSLFHGALMEMLDEEYVGKLHVDGVKPYSQSILIDRKGDCYWSVRTLTEEAYNNIILKLMNDDFKEITLKYDDVKIEIDEKTLKNTTISDLTKKFYNEDSAGFYNVYFESPTAFKVDGMYQFYPDIFHLFQSLMIRYDSICAKGSMFDEDSLNALVAGSRIISYRLHDERFGLEGVRIPSFKGEILIKVNGAQTMKNFAKLLLEFGNYSGVGIKTALGMGYIRMEEKQQK